MSKELLMVGIGEPIVNTPGEAYTCFMRTHIDALAIGSFLLRKAEQPRGAKTPTGVNSSRWTDHPRHER